LKQKGLSKGRERISTTQLMRGRDGDKSSKRIWSSAGLEKTREKGKKGAIIGRGGESLSSEKPDSRKRARSAVASGEGKELVTEKPMGERKSAFRP